MTNEQFKNLKEGDVIRNCAGFGFQVLRNAHCVVTIMHLQTLHGSENACDWTLHSSLCPVLPQRPPPTTCEMVLALDKAGWIYSECGGPHWIEPGSGGLFYSSLVAAFKSLKGTT